MRKKIVTLFLTVLFAAALSISASAETSFSDVPDGAWYYNYVYQLVHLSDAFAEADGLPKIISGYEDGTFRPEKAVTRGEFLKMICEACAAQGNDPAVDPASGQPRTTMRDDIHWSGKYFTMANQHNVLNSDAYSGGVMFSCTAEALDTPITRYEAAVILNNACTNIAKESPVTVSNASENIPYYWRLDTEYVTAVEQTYGRGLMHGKSDGAFYGEDTLKRCEAATIIYLFLWAGDREMPSWASIPSLSNTVTTPSVNAQNSFAFRYQRESGTANGLANLRREMFGSSSKSHFYSSADAAPYMETVTIPIWKYDNSGMKISSSMSVTVHKLVAEEIKSIFTEIYNDPEQFPIYGGWSVGGARFTDSMRHSWGMAIDVNAYYNAEMNFKSGYQRVTCGYGWWPYGLDGTTWVGRSASLYHGSMSGPSAYSISPAGSVVRAFAKYGWGWGGSGSNVIGTQKGWSSGNSFDFMHFSVLSTGG